MPLKQTVLVTDAEERAALAVVRSLGRAGYRVTVCSPRSRPLAAASRHCRRAARVPDPLRLSEIYADRVSRLVREWSVDVLLPITEASLLALLPRRHLLDDAVLPFATADLFSSICDKQRVLSIAADLGMAVPSQLVQEAAASDAAAFASLEYPVVVKPARSVAELRGDREKTTVSYAVDPDDLVDKLASLSPSAYPVLLQRRVIGPGLGVFLLRWGGEVLASFAHRRIREKPPAGGVSVYRRSVPMDLDLYGQACRLLERFDWNGVAMVEFKRDASSGRDYLMEVNGRFWGSLQLAIDAGVDFPALLVAAALGDEPPSVHRYRVGVASRWWWGDVDHLLARIRFSDADLRLSSDSHAKARALLHFMTLWRPGDRYEVLRLSDLRPFWAESVDWVRNVRSSRKRKGR